MNLVDPPPLPMRSGVDELALAALAEDIRSNGLLQPVGAIEHEGRYQVVFGHRRYMAHELNKSETIWALLYGPGELRNEAAMIAENLRREDVNDADLAVWFAELLDKHNWTFEQLLTSLNLREDFVNDRLALHGGDKAVFEALQTGKINFSVARELNKLPTPQWITYYLDIAVRVGMTARAIADARRQLAITETSTATQSEQTTPSTPAEPVQYTGPECFCCGGNKDPYNLVSVYIHKWEYDQIKKMLAEGAAV